MADYTDDEHINNQMENLPEEIISSGDIETFNPNLETENMEVHHHPQLEHKPKPWKEYILEYIMIVLAVTTGFFAENLREHITERHQEKEYIISLDEDMHENDSVLTSMIIAHQQNVLMMDSLIHTSPKNCIVPDTFKKVG